MSKIQVVSDDGSVVLSIIEQQEEEGTTVTCPVHGFIARFWGSLADVTNEAQIHILTQHREAEHPLDG